MRPRSPKRGHRALKVNLKCLESNHELLSMSSTAKTKGRAAGSAAVDRQIRRAKVVLRELRDTLEDLKDRRDLDRAKERNGGKPGIAWESVKKEFGFDF